MVERVEVAPFHKMGSSNWNELRMPYELADTRTADAGISGLGSSGVFLAWAAGRLIFVVLFSQPRTPRRRASLCG